MTDASSMLTHGGGKNAVNFTVFALMRIRFTMCHVQLSVIRMLHVTGNVTWSIKVTEHSFENMSGNECRAHGIRCRVAETESALYQQLQSFAGTEAGQPENKVMVFEARTDAGASMNQRNELWSCGS